MSRQIAGPRLRLRSLAWASLLVAGLGLVALLVWQAVVAGGSPDPTARGTSPATAALEAAVLVLREGLETIVVLAAITASLVGGRRAHRRPVAAGAGLALAASVATWFVVVALISAVNAPELDLQAATGLLAIVVLMVVMNWFFHKVYWTGWIAHHHRRRRRLLELGDRAGLPRLALGLGLLGFTSVYREGFEVVLFLQSLRLQVGTGVVATGVLLGLVGTSLVGVLVFVAHHRLPFKRMLVLTGALLGAVFLIMVGEQAQEMQLAGWIPTTPLPLPIPAWMGVWLALFPTAETLVAQALAAGVVLGSYFGAEYLRVRRPRRLGLAPAVRPEAPPS
ncbi:MAG TPA: FTR1 family protein [Candidatus Dormibacteraeota bacterium]|jgi:high-affinity iron transporter|nr:FTR1 family protein [Candidatus Dormibacteraeota bacterium]